ncbi:hypothetical protein [Kibdelosporangium philippinense]|uniref:hypothetical protein n=1 Tax=Kibdelosporangium philippinense TaxID=211113 RepID=UPI00360724C7
MSSLRSDGLCRRKPSISTPPHATDAALRLLAAVGRAASGVLRGVNARRDKAMHCQNTVRTEPWISSPS